MQDKDISEIPDKWVVVKIVSRKGTYFKIFASWSGGYLDGDRWRMNSGIASVETDDENYYFIGFSGSCYKCNKETHGTITQQGLSILDALQVRYSDSVVVLYDKSDWIGEFEIE